MPNQCHYKFIYRKCIVKPVTFKQLPNRPNIQKMNTDKAIKLTLKRIINSDCKMAVIKSMTFYVDFLK